MTKARIFSALAAVVAIAGSGIWYFRGHFTLQPMTIEQCRTALAASTEFRNLIANMDETNQSAAYETGAMRCALDHDPETASWSEEKKLAIVTRAYCNRHASGNYLIQTFCEQLMEKEKQRYKGHGIEAIIIPKSLK